MTPLLYIIEVLQPPCRPPAVQSRVRAPSASCQPQTRGRHGAATCRGAHIPPPQVRRQQNPSPTPTQARAKPRYQEPCTPMIHPTNQPRAQPLSEDCGRTPPQTLPPGMAMPPRVIQQRRYGGDTHMTIDIPRHDHPSRNTLTTPAPMTTYSTEGNQEIPNTPLHHLIQHV